MLGFKFGWFATFISHDMSHCIHESIQLMFQDRKKFRVNPSLHAWVDERWSINCSIRWITSEKQLTQMAHDT